MNALECLGCCSGLTDTRGIRFRSDDDELIEHELAMEERAVRRHEGGLLDRVMCDDNRGFATLGDAKGLAGAYDERLQFDSKVPADGRHEDSQQPGSLEAGR